MALKSKLVVYLSATSIKDMFLKNLKRKASSRPVPGTRYLTRIVKNITRGNWLLILHIFISSSLFSQENLLDKQVSLNFSEMDIADLLDSISNKEHLNFSYNSNIVPLSKKISISVNKEKLRTVLSQIFNYGCFEFNVINNQVVISKIPEITQEKENKIEDKYLIINGLVKDAKTKNILSYASVSLSEAGIGTITNSRGEFLFKVPIEDSGKNLTVSYMGYKNFDEKITNIPDSNFVIYLSSSSITFSEITVVPYDPILILKKAISRVDKNYDTKPVNLTAFLRETTRKEKQYISLSEAILNIYKAPYNNNLINDQAKIFKGRKRQDEMKMESVKFIVQGGIFNSLMLDIVKNAPDFISQDYIGYYKYTYGGIVDYQNRDAYLIEFVPVRTADIPIYKGQIYIDVVSYAIVSANFEISPDEIDYAQDLFIKKKPLFMNIRLASAQYNTNYRLTDGKWTLNNVRSELQFKIKNRRKLFFSTYYTTSELVVTKKDTTDAQQFKKKEIAKKSDILINQIKDGDDSFWGNYNIIRPDESIEKAIEKLPQIF